MRSDTKIFQANKISSEFSLVKRNVGYRKSHRENDSEHSFQLELIAWSANHQYKLGLDDEKILKLALVHDLVEVYTGDIDAHSSKKLNEIKKENERKALQKL